MHKEYEMADVRLMCIRTALIKVLHDYQNGPMTMISASWHFVKDDKIKK